MDEEFKALIMNSPLVTRKITPEYVESSIASEYYFTAEQGAWASRIGEGDPMEKFSLPGSLGMLTFCVLVMANGHRVVGINYGAIDPGQHSEKMGREEARKDAVNKVYEFLAYELRTKIDVIEKLKRGF